MKLPVLWAEKRRQIGSVWCNNSSPYSIFTASNDYHITPIAHMLACPLLFCASRPCAHSQWMVPWSIAWGQISLSHKWFPAERVSLRWIPSRAGDLVNFWTCYQVCCIPEKPKMPQITALWMNIAQPDLHTFVLQEHNLWFKNTRNIYLLVGLLGISKRNPHLYEAPF